MITGMLTGSVVVTEHGWSVVILVAAFAFLILMDRGFSAFKLTAGK